jgi:hypothetical protein
VNKYSTLRCVSPHAMHLRVRLYKSQNKKSLVDKIYELVSGVVSEEHFIELFEYATEKPYSAFVIDNHKETPKENKFKINWNTIIRIN